ncbi:MAG: peptidoglycan-binding domain-containing protein [Bacteroidota bacterium]
MRRPLAILVAFVLFSATLIAQTVPPLPAGLPPEGEADKCYAICYIPQKWETVTENVQTYGGGSSLVAVLPQYETITERVMIKPAGYKLITMPAEYEEVEERIEVAAAYTEYSIEPAQFETVTERVLIEEGTERIRSGSAQYTTVTNANLYYGTPDPNTIFKSADYGNILDPNNPQGVGTPSSPFNPSNPNSLLNDPNSPFNASPATYGNSGNAALLDPTNPESPFNEDYIERNGIDASIQRANSILAESGVGAITPYLETEARVEIDRIPREFETIAEEIEVQPAYVTYEQAPAPCADGKGDCISWCAITVPAQFETVNRRVAKACAEGYTIASEEQGGDEYCIRLRYTPAVYGARQVMTGGPTIEYISTEPRYRTVTTRKLVSEAKVVERKIPAKYETITKRVVKREAFARYELEPAEYKTVTRRVRRGLKGVDYITTGGVFMAGPEQYDGSTTPSGTASGLPMALNPAAGYPVAGSTLPIRVGSGPDRAGQVEAPGFGTVNTDLGNIPAGMPSNYYTAGCPTGYQFDPRDGLCKATATISAEQVVVTKRVPNGTGNFSQWEEVLCPNKVTDVSIRAVQRALNAAGYNAGVADGIFGARSKAALAKYQKDKGLPIGGLNTATLRALGLRK